MTKYAWVVQMLGKLHGMKWDPIALWYPKIN